MPTIPERPESSETPKQQAEHPIFAVPKADMKGGDRNKAMQEVGPYLTLGFQMAMFVGIGLAIGWYIDKDSGSSFWMGILAAVGAGAGLVYFLMTVMKMEKEKKNKKH